jgi:hypothetical protein
LSLDIVAYHPSNCSSSVEIESPNGRDPSFACGAALVSTQCAAVSIKLEAKNRFVMREILIAWPRASGKIAKRGGYDNWILAGIVMQFLLTALVKH